MRSRLLTSAALLGLLLLAACATVPGIPAGEVAATWNNPALDEASGLHWWPQAGLLLAHNDDRDTTLYTAHPDGRPGPSLHVPWVPNRDWEDLTGFPGPDGRTVLVLGEIGDNDAQYPSIALHFLRLPERAEPYPTPEFLGTLPLLFPGGPRDCEGLAYDPRDRTLLLLTKRDRPPLLFSLPLPALPLPPNPAPVTLTPVATLDTLPPPNPDFLAAHPRTGRWSAQPTAFAIAPDGSIAAVLTYDNLHLYRRASGESWPAAFARPPLTLDVPPLRQAEALCFGAASDELWITSEGPAPPLVRLLLPPPPAFPLDTANPNPETGP